MYLYNTFLMIFGIKEKSIILTHTMYCWLLLHICRANYDWFYCPGSHFINLQKLLFHTLKNTLCYGQNICETIDANEEFLFLRALMVESKRLTQLGLLGCRHTPARSQGSILVCIHQ